MFKSKILALVELARPYNVARWVLSFCVGYFFAGSSRLGINFVVGLVAVILVHIFITVQNDLADLSIDKVNSPSRPLPSKTVSEFEARAMIYLSLCLLLGLCLINFPSHIYFVILMIIISWAYNRRPILLSHKPVLSILSLSFLYSAMPLGYGYFLRHVPLDYKFTVFLIGWWIIRFGTSILKDFRDISGDVQNDKRTFVIVFGKRAVSWISLIGVALGYLGIMSILWQVKHSLWLLLPSLVALKNIIFRLKLFKTNDGTALNKQFVRILAGQNQFDLTVLLCLIFLK